MPAFSHPKLFQGSANGQSIKRYGVKSEHEDALLSTPEAMNKHDRQPYPDDRCGRDAGRAAIQVLVKKDVEQSRTATGSLSTTSQAILFAMLSGNPVA